MGKGSGSNLEVDASNACIPPIFISKQTLHALTPPLPMTVRGEPLVVDGKCGRLNVDRSVLVYGSGRLVVVRELDVLEEEEKEEKVKAFVYRGHTAKVTAAKFSPTGCYVASADIRGKLRVWSYDNEEHLCKLDLCTALAGPIRDICWDCDSRRICVVGEGSPTDASSPCCRVFQWDTGVTCGDLATHNRGRASSCSFKPNRPMRIVTSGTDDSRVLFNSGPPFSRTALVPDDGVSSEKVHERGAVHCVRYSEDGKWICSVGTDRSVCWYDGKSMKFECRLEDVHDSSIYSCAWSLDGELVLTCGADGKVKLIEVISEKKLDPKVVYEWDLVKEQRQLLPEEGNQASSRNGKVPVGGIQLGCAFVGRNNTPVAISLNGVISILPMPSHLQTTTTTTTTTPTTTKFLIGHRSVTTALAIDRATGIMHTGDTDGTICIWDLNTACALGHVQSTNNESLENKIHTGAITSMIFANGMILSCGWDDVVRITEQEKNGKEVMKRSLCSGKIDIPAQPNALAKGTELIVVMTVDGLLLLEGNEVISKLIPLSFNASSVAVSPDDKTIFVGGEDCNIHIYSIIITTTTTESSTTTTTTTLNEIHTIRNGHLKPIHALSLSHDGTQLASADTRDICVWSTTGDYKPIIGKSRWCFHTQRISCLAWNDDGTVLASGGNDDSIYLWSLKKKTKRVHYPFAHRGGVTDLEFWTPGVVSGGDDDDGDVKSILVSVGSDGCVNQWDVTKDVKEKFG